VSGTLVDEVAARLEGGAGALPAVAAPDALRDVAAVLAGGLAAARPPSPPAVLVCADDPLVAGGLARLAERGLGARAEVAGSIEEAERELRRRPPDLLVCEDRLGGRPVHQVLRPLRRAGPCPPLVVVAPRPSDESLRAALLAGAAGYMARSEAASRLPAALRAVRGGRTALPQAPLPPVPLTPREQELVAALDEGLRFKQVALRLAISEATVKTHARNLFRKLGATSRAEAVRAARDRGLLA
jgi:DNA-binding NarL/FixJ family response regulator